MAAIGRLSLIRPPDRFTLFCLLIFCLLIFCLLILLPFDFSALFFFCLLIFCLLIFCLLILLPFDFSALFFFCLLIFCLLIFCLLIFCLMQCSPSPPNFPKSLPWSVSLSPVILFVTITSCYRVVMTRFMVSSVTVL